MNVRRALMSVGLSATVVLIGVLIVVSALGSRPNSSVGAATPDTKVTNVRVQVLTPSTLTDTLSLTGSVVPWEEIVLSAETLGSIEWQGIDDGDQVTAGQTLVRIDTKSLEARHDQALAQLKLAEQELMRVDALSTKGVSSPQELDRVQANRDVAASDVQVSEIALDKSVVRAPIAGIADTVFHEVAEFVDVGTPLVRIVQVDPVKVIVGIPEKELPLVGVGDSVAVIIDALPDEVFEGAIYRVATTAETSTRTFAAEVEIGNSGGLLRPGMIARVRLARKTYADAIAVPIYSIISRSDRRVVFVETDGVAHERQIGIGFYQNNMVHVIDGLDPGDRLIVVGQRDLRDGQPVNVQSELN